ncbi:unnamed protein product [Moneuplotes crassus]|uniref:histidine kinase n=1 Tax=Euplotes crassus TaxID=5936 RepID=A0AAD2D9R4_EUPCR|nr:unnamed protein product [Moneuplotes crassus]
MIIGNVIFTIASLLACFLISYFPDYVKFYMVISCSCGLIMIDWLFASYHEGHFNSYVSCAYCYCYFTAILTPSKKHLNILVFAVSVFGYLYQSYCQIGSLDSAMILSSLTSLVYFYFGLNIIHYKLKIMYEIILKNERLVKEKEKVVIEFPHPVLILPENGTKSFECYSNSEFESKISSLKHKIENLTKIEVSIKKDQNQEHLESKLSLLEYLAEQQKHIKNADNKRDFVKNLDNLERSFLRECVIPVSNDKTGNIANRNFNIKSLKIEWKGHPSFMHVFIDHTDIIKLEQAKNRIKMQRIMFASASHEFRTPLNCIINSYEFIKESFQELISIIENTIPERIQQSLEFQNCIITIQQFTKNGRTSSILLLSLVEDILNLSKIDNGTFMTNYEDFNVFKLLKEVQPLFIVQCQSKGVELEIQCEQGLKCCEVNSDRNRIRQVLLNLISNSSKFTFRGNIIVRAKMIKTIEGDSYIEFSVEDTGTGIKKEDQENIFTLFGVIETNNNLNPTGCGLGLTISKKYVETLGGKIIVESVYGEGTRMIFTILLSGPKIRNKLSSAFLLSEESSESLSPLLTDEYSNLSIPLQSLRRCNKYQFLTSS